MESTLRRSTRFDVRRIVTAIREKFARRDQFGFDYTAEICLTDELERKLSQQAGWPR
jgi:hypothetical protein